MHLYMTNWEAYSLNPQHKQACSFCIFKCSRQYNYTCCVLLCVCRTQRSAIVVILTTSLNLVQSISKNHKHVYTLLLFTSIYLLLTLKYLQVYFVLLFFFLNCSLNVIPLYLDVAFVYLLCFFICSAAIFGKTDWNIVVQIRAGE